MAKKSSIAKNNKRRALSVRVFAKREALKARLVALHGSLDSSSDATGEIMKIMMMLDENRSKSYIRHRNRCSLTGRPRAVLGRFALCRNAVRIHAGFGRLVGVKKAS